MNFGINQIKKHIIRTPLLPFLEDKRCNSRIFLKPENLQIFGSYKIRGVAQVIEDADRNILKGGLSAASAGNMAQVVAYAAQCLSIPCKLYIPDSAPHVKKESVRNLGAEIIELPYQTIWQMVTEDCSHDPETGIFIHPASNSSLLKGYASIAQEIIEDMPDVEAVVIPFGVGGLSIGVGTALRQLKPDVALFTCEPETAAPLKKSLQDGTPCSINRLQSFVDAIGTPEVLPFVFDSLKSLISDSIVVDLVSIKQMIHMLLQGNKLLCEGAAACAAAASVQLASQSEYKKIVCILSGGNISSELSLLDAK